MNIESLKKQAIAAKAVNARPRCPCIFRLQRKFMASSSLSLGLPCRSMRLVSAHLNAEASGT